MCEKARKRSSNILEEQNTFIINYSKENDSVYCFYSLGACFNGLLKWVTSWNRNTELKLMEFLCFSKISFSLTSFSDSLFQAQTWSPLCLSNPNPFLPVFCNPLITVTLSLAGGCFCWVELFSTNNTKSYGLCVSLCSLVTSNANWLVPH